MALKDIPQIQDEFPGWEGWQSLRCGQYHARLRGAEPPFMLHDDHVEGLREQIRQAISRFEDIT